MNAKRKGTHNEHRSKAIFETAGYAVCRAAASLGAWDEPTGRPLMTEL